MKLTLAQYQTLKVKIEFTLLDDPIAVYRGKVLGIPNVSMHPLQESIAFLSADLGLEATIRRIDDSVRVFIVVDNSFVLVGDNFVRITDSDDHHHLFHAEDIGIELVLDNLPTF